MDAGWHKAVDERLFVPRARGGGIVRREIWIDAPGHVVRYNLAYINHLIYSGDNGRVLGYDSAHGSHHRHYKGKVTAVELESFEEIDAAFQKEWIDLVRKVKYENN
jgi:Family of unknown function (DUF6516)